MLKIATIGAALALGPGAAFAQALSPAQVDISKPALANTNSFAVKKSSTNGTLARAILRSASAKTEPAKIEAAKSEPEKNSKISLR